jgi:hypothetical protein
MPLEVHGEPPPPSQYAVRRIPFARAFKEEKPMKIIANALTLTCALGAILSAGAAQARPSMEGYCEQQLDYCLMIAFVPEPCYHEYERCVSGGWGTDIDAYQSSGRIVIERRGA